MQDSNAQICMLYKGGVWRMVTFSSSFLLHTHIMSPITLCNTIIKRYVYGSYGVTRNCKWKCFYNVAKEQRLRNGAWLVTVTWQIKIVRKQRTFKVQSFDFIENMLTLCVASEMNWLHCNTFFPHISNMVSI